MANQKSARTDVLAQLASGANKAFAEINQQRERIKALRKRIYDLEAAPVASDETEHRISRLVEAARGQVIASAVISSVASPSYRESPTSSWMDALPAFQLAAFLDLDSLRAKLIAAVDETKSDFEHPAVSEPERRLGIDRASAEILAAEVACELYCRRLESAGLGVARDASADPAVILAPTSELESFNVAGAA